MHLHEFQLKSKVEAITMPEIEIIKTCECFVCVYSQPPKRTDDVERDRLMETENEEETKKIILHLIKTSVGGRWP
ncbi:uncharacterized protein DS421_13g436820 [Arachis hypogaea]|nr:uncharacterized protein DS421_13g436820 [Arachis hypogaea]